MSRPLPHRRRAGRASALPALAALTAALVVGSLASAPTASAHERTSSGVDLTTRIVAAPDGVDVLVEVRMGESAAAEEAKRLDADGDGRVSDAERSAYEEAFGRRVRSGVAIEIAGERATPRLASLRVTFPLGPTGLTELVARARLAVAWPAALVKAPPDEVALRVELSLWRKAAGHAKVIVTGRPTGSVRYKPLRDAAGGPHPRAVGAEVRYRPRAGLRRPSDG